MGFENKLAELRKIVDLHSYVIKPEKINGKLIFDKLIKNEGCIICLSAIVWNKNDYLNYKKYTVSIKLHKDNFNYRKIKIVLLYKLYYIVSKNF